MSGADRLAGIILPPKVRKCVDQHLGGIERAQAGDEVRRWLDRAQSLIEGLEAAGALNASTIEALYIHFDDVALARLAELGG